MKWAALLLVVIALGASVSFAESSAPSSDGGSDPQPVPDDSSLDSMDIFVFSGGSDVKLSAVEIAQYASSAGFSGDALPTAVAVALAESGGNPQAYNPEVAAGTPPGRGSYGLWQIYRKAHPEFDGVDLTDPGNNAAAAYAVYSAAGFSFRPWSTFKNQAFQKHLAEANAAVNESLFA